GRKLLVHILDPRGKEVFSTQGPALPDQPPVKIRVPIVVAPTSATIPLTDLAASVKLQLPPHLLSALTQHKIGTLSDIRQAGGLRSMKDLPVAANDPALLTLEAHAELSRISPDVQVNAALIQKGFTSVAAIANTLRVDFIQAAYDQLGD